MGMKRVGPLVQFRNDIEQIKETGDIEHDNYLRDLKKKIDDELSKPEPNSTKVMEFIMLNRMKQELIRA